MKKIAVVGPIPRDTIITHKNETIKKYGCVTHPAIALAKLMEDKGEVIVISHIHKKDKSAVNELFHPYKNVNTAGIDSTIDRGTVIELKFVDQNNRLEKQTAFMNPISPKDVTPFLDADAFVFVPITDFEISLSTLQHIKENSNAIIIFDAQNLTAAGRGEFAPIDSNQTAEGKAKNRRIEVILTPKLDEINQLLTEME